MKTLKMGDVIRIRPDADGVEAGIYIIISDPAAPIVQISLAGEDEEGAIIETERLSFVPRDTLAAADLLNIEL